MPKVSPGGLGETIGLGVPGIAGAPLVQGVLLRRAQGTGLLQHHPLGGLLADGLLVLAAHTVLS
ncbi:hypothetical protein D3C78_1916810 [compost metagenome]